MLQFQTVGNTLKVSNESATVFSISKKDVYYIQSSLNEDVPKISLYNLNVGVFAVVFQALLSDCSDPNGDPFTVNSFTTFAEDNLGFNSGGTSPSITVTDSYATLPDPTTVSGQFYWCENADGTFPVGLYYSDGTAWQFQTSENITVVANYSALPDPTTVSGQFFWAESSQGTSWLPAGLGGTYYSAGMYYSNGVSWSFIDVPYQATQSEVNAGTNNNKFVTPSTLKNQNYLGTVTSVSALTLGTSGTDLSSTVANETTTPTITLNVPTASATNRGALSSTDWSTFNNKQDNIWEFCTKKGVIEFYDFIGGSFVSTVETWGLSTRVTSGDATITSAATFPNRTRQQGVISMNTNTNSASAMLLRIGEFNNNGGGFAFGNGTVIFETYICINTLSTVTDRFVSLFGMSANVSYNTGACLFFLYDEGGTQTNLGAASPNFRISSFNGTTRINTTTAVPIVAQQWYKLKIVVNDANTQVEYFIDDISVATHAIVSPNLVPRIPFFKTIGTSNRILYIDYMGAYQRFTNER